MKKQIAQVAAWLRKNEKMLIYGAGLVIISLLCFVFGVLKGTGLSQEPITVMRPASEPVILTSASEDTESTTLTPEECKFVGSVKGSKYYPPSCSYAKKIAKENLRCFKSEQDAKEKGYEKTTSCK